MKVALVLWEMLRKNVEEIYFSSTFFLTIIIMGLVVWSWVQRACHLWIKVIISRWTPPSFFENDEMQQYQSLVRAMHWAISIGCFNIATAIMTMHVVKLLDYATPWLFGVCQAYLWIPCQDELREDLYLSPSAPLCFLLLHQSTITQATTRHSSHT